MGIANQLRMSLSTLQGSWAMQERLKGYQAGFHSAMQERARSEHGGDPDSIGFFHSVGLNYVSCSPPRVPVARLAAAQAAIKG